MLATFADYTEAALRFGAVATMAALVLAGAVGMRRGAWRSPSPPGVRLWRWAGATCMASGLFVHQTHWLMWKLAGIAGHVAMKGRLEALALPIMLPSYLLWISGAVMLLAGFTYPRWGRRRWLPVSALLVLGLLVLGYLTALGVR